MVPICTEHHHVCFARRLLLALPEKKPYSAEHPKVGARNGQGNANLDFERPQPRGVGEKPNRTHRVHERHPGVLEPKRRQREADETQGFARTRHNLFFAFGQLLREILPKRGHDVLCLQADQHQLPNRKPILRQPKPGPAKIHRRSFRPSRKQLRRSYCKQRRQGHRSIPNRRKTATQTTLPLSVASTFRPTSHHKPHSHLWRTKEIGKETKKPI